MEERAHAVQTGTGERAEAVQSRKEELLVAALRTNTGEQPAFVQNETQERLVAARIAMKDQQKAVHTHRPTPSQIPLQ